MGLSPPAGLQVHLLAEAGVELARVLLIDGHSNHAGAGGVADLHNGVVIHGEVLALLVEAIAGETAGVFLVLDEGALLAVADVESDVAVIAGELG